jgi:polyhydroxyalkanoate synthesis regulator phasin
MSTMNNHLPEPDDIDPVALANRRAKGKRPAFLEDPAVERVLSIAMAVAGELAVTRERIDTLERLLAQRGILGAADIEAYVPDDAAQEQRNQWGREYIARVLRMIDQDAQALAGEPDAALEQVISALRSGALDGPQ